MIATLPPRPIPPVQPIELRNLIQEHNRLARQWVKAVQLGLEVLIPGTSADVRNAAAQIAAWRASPPGVAYRQAIRDYNAAAQRFNAARAAEQQARLNAAEVAKVRRSTCPSCFTALPTSGVCGQCC